MKIQFNEIIDPKTNKKYSITSRKGKQILNNYIKTVEQHGGFIFTEPITFIDVDTENPQDDEICLVNSITDPSMDAHGWITADSLRGYLKQKVLHNIPFLDQNNQPSVWEWTNMVKEFKHWLGGLIDDDIWPEHLLELKNKPDHVTLGTGQDHQGPINRFHNFMRAERKADGGIRIVRGIEKDTPEAEKLEARRIINANIELIINKAKEKAERYFNQYGHAHPGTGHTAAPPAAAQEHGPALARQNTQERDRDEQVARGAQLNENILAERHSRARQQLEEHQIAQAVQASIADYNRAHAPRSAAGAAREASLRARERLRDLQQLPGAVRAAEYAARAAANRGDGGASHYQRQRGYRPAGTIRIPRRGQGNASNAGRAAVAPAPAPAPPPRRRPHHNPRHLELSSDDDDL